MCLRLGLQGPRLKEGMAFVQMIGGGVEDEGEEFEGSFPESPCPFLQCLSGPCW